MHIANYVPLFFFLLSVHGSLKKKKKKKSKNYYQIFGPCRPTYDSSLNSASAILFYLTVLAPTIVKISGVLSLFHAISSRLCVHKLDYCGNQLATCVRAKF